MRFWCTLLLVITALILLLVYLATQSTLVHHVLEDVQVEDLKLSSGNPGVLESGTLDFLVRSRNPTGETVQFWHKKIEVEYRGFELAKKSFLPFGFLQQPHSVSHLHAPLKVGNITLPMKIASELKRDMEIGIVPLRIRVQMRGTLGKSSWFWDDSQVLGADDGCSLRVSVRRRDQEDGSSLRGRRCEWVLRPTQDMDDLW